MRRIADKFPALGFPGGPCQVVERIEDEISNPKLQERLVNKVEKGKSLTNPEAHQIYDIEKERGPGGFIRTFEITSHALYRMDLRGVTVPEIRIAFKQFLKDLNDWKSQGSYEYQLVAKAIAQQQPIEYEFKQIKLFMVFLLVRKGHAKLVTVYWKGIPDPKAPGNCIIPQSRLNLPESRLSGWRAPAEDLSGHRTVVKDHHPSEDNREKQQVLPSPPWTRSKPTESWHFNTPPSSGEAPGGSLHEDRVRTKSEPGKMPQKTVPRNGPARRPEVLGGGDELEAVWFDALEPQWRDDEWGYPPVGVPDGHIHLGAMKGIPGTDRQRKQRGQAKRYFKKYYIRNRPAIKRRMKKWHRKNRPKGRYKRDQARRDKWPQKFKRRPGGGASSIKERSKNYREEQSKRAGFSLDLFFLPTQERGSLEYIDPDTGLFHINVAGNAHLIPMDLVFDQILLDEIGHFGLLAYMDHLFEVDLDDMAPQDYSIVIQRVAQRWVSRQAEMLYTKGEHPFDVDTYYSRADNRVERKDRKDPLTKQPQPIVEENPGSAKVIPWDHPQMVNNKSARVAALLGEIVEACGQDLVKRSQGIKPKLRRVDAKNAVWLFDVPSSKGDAYRVRVKAARQGNIRDVRKLHLKVSCSCPFWQWQGPEYHAKEGGYLYGRPKGTASKPDTKDPGNQHHACKHALAVLDFIKSNEWSVPPTRKAAAQYLFRTMKVAARSLERLEENGLLVIRGPYTDMVNVYPKLKSRGFKFRSKDKAWVIPLNKLTPRKRQGIEKLIEPYLHPRFLHQEEVSAEQRREVWKAVERALLDLTPLLPRRNPSGNIGFPNPSSTVKALLNELGGVEIWGSSGGSTVYLGPEDLVVGEAKQIVPKLEQQAKRINQKQKQIQAVLNKHSVDTVSASVDGAWVLFKSPHYELNQILKQAKGRWDRTSRLWMVPLEEITLGLVSNYMEQASALEQEAKDKKQQQQQQPQTRNKNKRYLTRPYREGDLLYDKQTDSVMEVVRTFRKYREEDGMSLGYLQDEVTLYPVEVKPARPEAAKAFLERQKGEQQEQENVIQRRVSQRRLISQLKSDLEKGQRPKAKFPKGEELSFNLHLISYGGGYWFVRTPQALWYIENNGADGSDWSQNNIQTGGAGAIGWKKKRSAKLDQAFDDLKSLLPPKQIKQT